MHIRMALISSQAYQKYISSIAQKIADIQLDFYVYEEPEQATQLLHELQPCDALIIGGFLPYLEVKPLLPSLRIPYTHFIQDEATISTTLLAAITKYHIPLNQISIDVIEPTFVTSILQDIHQLDTPPYIHDATQVDVEQRHRTLYDEGHIQLIITSVHQLYEKLKANGYPVMRMQESTSATIQKLEKMRDSVLLQKSNANRMTAGVLKIHPEDEAAFIHFTQAIHANYTRQNTHRMELYTTIGHLEQLLHNEKQLKAFLAYFKKPYQMGFGYGESISEALQHAQDALQFTKTDEIYILDEYSRLLGPYPTHQTILPLKFDSEKQKEMAERTKLSVLSLSKMSSFIEERHTKHFTAQDVADHLHVTRRTAERMIKKLLEHGYLAIISSEMTYKKGRPRAVYTWIGS